MKTYRGKELKALTDEELAEAVRSIPYQTLEGELAIRAEVSRRHREEGVQIT